MESRGAEVRVLPTLPGEEGVSDPAVGNVGSGLSSGIQSNAGGLPGLMLE